MHKYNILPRNYNQVLLTYSLQNLEQLNLVGNFYFDRFRN